jgi:uncharacterized protein YjiS (DUF1127 family)
MKNFLRKVMQAFELAGYRRAANQLNAMGYVKEAKRILDEEAAKRQTFKELNALTDKELQDIGIARGEIYDIAYNKSTHPRVAA